MTGRVLVVEDENDIAELVRVHLLDLGLGVERCTDGLCAVRRGLGECWELLVLDLGLPGLDGVEVCRELRTRGCFVPILMLTARTTESDLALGLAAGADDYLTKPFGIVEFVARVKAMLRRVEYLRVRAPEGGSVLRAGDLEIDLDRRSVRRGRQRIDLTAREYDLLAYLIRHPGKVFTRAQLLDQVWGLTHDAYEHTVSSHINRLRAKLEPDPAAPKYLLTNWGAGYSLAAD